MPSYRKKLIEVALPLDAINKESAREKSIRHGHPSTLHLWWARRPLAACRAVLFSQLVDDPSEYMPDEKSADEERERLFDLIEELVLWENINNEEVLDRAKLEIARSVARDLGVDVPVGKEAIREFLATMAPPVLDPFAGGGSIPLEAQRLGLRAYASDLNPVAVLINKALIEIPPKYANMPPVHPREETTNGHEFSRKNGAGQGVLWKKQWKGAEGLAEDVRYYGRWMRDEAYKRIGHLYPKYKITQELLDERPDLKAQGLKSGDELTVIAWLWARTVKCPNPACGAEMPLLRTFWLSTKKGRECWLEPIRDMSKPYIRFQVKRSLPQHRAFIDAGSTFVKENGKKVKATFRCLRCENSIVKGEYLDQEANNGRMGAIPTAIVADGPNGRLYLPFDYPQAEILLSQSSSYRDKIELEAKIPSEPARGTFASNAQGRKYGFRTFADYFTNRQLSTLVTFVDSIRDVRQKILEDLQETIIAGDGITMRMGDTQAKAYSDAVSTYLSFALDKAVDYWSSLCSWHISGEKMRNTFGRQAIAMVWDYAECNPFSDSTGNWNACVEWVYKVLSNHGVDSYGIALQANASEKFINVLSPIISTDPPYYGNVGYSELSDFFYVWLRRSIGDIYPDIFSTMLTPKSLEIVATPFRFDGNREKAEIFFLRELGNSFKLMNKYSNRSYPVTVYYAFKQTEDEKDNRPKESTGIASTGWEKMLQGLLAADFQISGTWPMRTELANRMVSTGSNALASSIVLVCRLRSNNSIIATRRDFMASLKQELPSALRKLQQGSVAPVDLAQAAIGPGMAIFSRYKQVLEADGSPMRVRSALAIINQGLDEFLAEQEGDYDADTRWALAWYEQYGFNDGPYGVAETLSKAKNTSVGGLEEAGVLVARAGKVRLLPRTELKEDWDPSQDKRPTAWEAVQYLIRALDMHGEQGAALLLSRLGGLGETARDLAYRLYTICERKGWAQDALGYNMLVVAWPRLKEMARSTRPPEQGRLL